MTDPTLDITLVVPAYNEEDRIGTSLKEIARFVEGCSGEVEVLIVDDGSHDKTAEIVEYFIEEFSPHSRLSLLQYGENRGKGFAVAHGFKKAQGRRVVFSDTDLSAPIDQIPRLLEALDEGADIAIGSRRLPESVVEGLPRRRVLMGRVFSWVAGLLVALGVKDTQCGFKAYTSEAAKKLSDVQRIEGYTFDVEHLLWARVLGMRVTEVPVRWVYTEGSQVNGISDSIKMFRDLLRLRLRFARMKNGG